MMSSRPRERLAALSIAVFVLMGLLGSVLRVNHTSSSIHRLLSRAERDLRPVQPRLLRPGLRFATFGSFNTWGASADLPSRYFAYPYLLSEQVDNYADFSAGPNYPAVCTETLVDGEKIYDVVMLDFYLRAHEGLFLLAKRLRQRFPKALIVFVVMWAPYMVRRSSPDNGIETLFEWEKRRGLDYEHRATEWRNALIQDTGHWWFPERKRPEEIVANAAKFVNGHVWRMWRPTDGKETLLKQIHLFDWTHQHLSRLGHSIVANETAKVIHSLIENPAEQIVSAEIGTWGRGDQCDVWFTTGDTGKCKYSAELHLVEYDEKHGKFALEVGPSGGHFNVTNPFEHPRPLYLSFLASSPPYIQNAAHEVNYPKTRFIVNGVSVDIQPVTDHDRYRIHIPQTIRIGNVNPGVNQIQVKPLHVEEGVKPRHHFRIVGASLTAEEGTPGQDAFTPPFNV